ncbi:hypothetical protein ACHAXR_004914 [Thalassiosira sp. AJA248-18]
MRLLIFAWQNRSSGDKPQRPPAATPSPNTKAKKKRKKKKKKATDDTETPEKVNTPKSDMDLSAVNQLLQKFNMEDQLDESAVYHALTNSPYIATGSMTGPQRMERQFLLELAHDNFRKLATFVGVECPTIPKPTFVAKTDTPTVHSVLDTLFHLMKSANKEPLWVLLDDTDTSPILEEVLASSVESLKWFEENASDALEAFAIKQVRQKDVTVLLNAGVHVSCKSVATLFSGLTKGKGHQFNNTVARILCDKSEIFMQNQSDYKLVMDAVSDKVGKAGKLNVNSALKQAFAIHKSKNTQRSPEKKATFTATDMSKNKKDAPPTKESLKAKKAQEEAEKKLAALKLKTHKITSALQWYNSLLDELNASAESVIDGSNFDEYDEDEKKCEDGVEESTTTSSTLTKKSKPVLTSDQVIEALSNCDSEELLASVETNIDLFQWDSMSEWTIDITEQAHKWFRRHIKKDRALCERIIRRLTVSTQHFAYIVLVTHIDVRVDNFRRKIEVPTQFITRCTTSDILYSIFQCLTQILLRFISR